MDNVIKPEQVQKYMRGGKDFIDEDYINDTLMKKNRPEQQEIKEIIAKPGVERLDPKKLLLC